MGNTTSFQDHQHAGHAHESRQREGSIPEEPTWALPSAQLDQQWLQACMDEMFDKEFMKRSFHGPDMTMIGPFDAKEEEGAEDGAKGKSDKEADLAEAEALADAVACLAYPYDATARRMTVARLTDGLTRQCREEDPFTTTAAQRIHFLRCMHAAMVRTWPRQQKPNGGNGGESMNHAQIGGDGKDDGVLNRVLRDVSIVADDEDEESVDDADIRRRRRRRRRPTNTTSATTVIKKTGNTEPTTQADTGELSHTVRMGLTLFFTMLECLQHKDACTPEQYAQLMREMVPIVTMLSPPQVVEEDNKAPFAIESEEKKTEEDREKDADKKILPKVGVLNEICDFLYRASMGRKYLGNGRPGMSIDDELLIGSVMNKPMPLLPLSNASSKLKKNGSNPKLKNPVNEKGDTNETKYETLPISARERTQALEALYSLACTRASLVDFLLCIKVLLEDVCRGYDLGKNGSGKLKVSTSAPGFGANNNNEAMSPSTSPNNADHGERSPDAGNVNDRKRGWRAVEDIQAIGGQNFVIPSLNRNSSEEEVLQEVVDTNTAGAEFANSAASGVAVSKNKNNNNSIDDGNSNESVTVSSSVGATSTGTTASMKPISKRAGKSAAQPHPWEASTTSNRMAPDGYASRSNNNNSNHNNNNTEEARSPREWRIRQQNSLLQENPDSIPFLEDVQLLDKVGMLSKTDCRNLYKAEVLGGKAEQVEVWSFGQNSYGELALGDTLTRKIPKKADVLNGKDVVQVAAGNEHTVVLTRGGKVYAVGYNDNGQCGQGNTGRVAHLSNIEALNGKNVTQVHAYNGCEHTLCVTAEGALYTFGYNYRGQLGHGSTASLSVPQLVPGFGMPGRRVKYVSCSYYHSVIATDNGAMYSFGRNDFGQLGHGDTLDRKEPAKVEGIPPGELFTSVACGQYHTIVAVSSGAVYACGKNDYGQLGLKLPEAHRRITPVRFFGQAALRNGPDAVVDPEEEMDTHIKEIRCGYYHTIALSTSGKVWAFGRNDYGQLGIGNAMQKVFAPHEVEDLDGRTTKVVKIAAGCYHSIAVDENDTLYVFGRNNHGQLGCGEASERHTPWPIKSFNGSRIADVAAGFYHTIVLTGGEDERDEREDEESLLFHRDEDEHLRTPVLLLKEDCLNSRNGLLTPFQLAFITLLALDRMCAFHKGRQENVHKWRGRGYPALDPNSALERLTDKVMLPPANIPFCIDSDPRTLPLLVFIAKLCQTQLARLEHQQVTPSFVDNSDNNNPKGAKQQYSSSPVDDGRVWSYLILATMRLMRANLAQLLWSGNGLQLQKEMSMATHHHHHQQQQQQQQHQQQQQQHHQNQQMSPMVKALDEIHRFALETIESPPHMMDPESMETAQALASEILMTGLELFYPTQELQVQLLASLMAESEDEVESPQQQEKDVSDEHKDDEMLMGIKLLNSTNTPRNLDVHFSPRSPLLKFQSITTPAGFSKSGLRKYLLEPLLKRLSDDELVSAMVPYHSMRSFVATPCARGVVQRATGGSSDNTQASVALLSSLLGSLVKQLATQATKKIRKECTSKSSFALSNDKKRQQLLPHTLSRSNGFLQLLLSLQKHLLSWAANSSHPSEEPSKVNLIANHVDAILDRLNLSSTHAPPPVHVGDGGESASFMSASSSTTSFVVDDDAVSFDGFAWKAPTKSSSSSWECLLRYSELVFRKCNNELAELLDEAEQYLQQQSHDMMEHLISILGSTSVVSGVLPSLVVGLSLFAHRTFFAIRLLPRVLDTLELIDKVNRLLPSIVEADRVYREASDRYGATPKRHSSSNGGEQADEKDLSKKKRMEEALNTASLPWLLQLEKGLASLGGRLASTLVTGHVEGEMGSPNESFVPGEDPALTEAYVMWRDSSLFKGGFDPRFVSRVHCSDGLLFFDQVHEQEKSNNPTDEAPSSPHKVTRSQKAHHNVETDEIMRMFSTHEIEQLLCGIAFAKEDDSIGKRFVDTLRKAYGKKNFAYNMSLVQGRGNGGADANSMEMVERSILASVIKHSGLTYDALMYAQLLHEGKENFSPTPRLLDCFKAAAAIRTHLVRLRSQFMASTANDDDSNSFQEICTCYIRRGQFLLLFAPAVCYHGDEDILMSQKLRNGERLSDRSKPWDRVKKAFWTMVRWKRLTKESLDLASKLNRPNSENAIVNIVLQFVKQPVDVTIDGSQPPSSPTRKPGSPTKRRKQLLQQQFFNVGVLFMMIFNNCRRAYLRGCGLDAFRHLISIPELASPRTDILRYLAPSLRSASVKTSSSSSSSSMGKKGDVAKSDSGASEDQKSNYASYLGATGPQLLEHVHRSFLGLYQDLAHSLKNALGETSVASSQERLLLIDTWAMSIGPIDLELLSRTGLLQVLQSALKLDHESEQQSQQQDLKNYDDLRRRQIGKAAWMLFRLLLTQVGEGRDEGEIEQLLQVLYSEMVSASDLMLPKDKKTDEEEDDSSNNKNSKNSKELIGSPVRFNSVGSGMVIPSRGLQQQQVHEEFSITFWVFLEHQSTGFDRVLLCRGSDDVQVPIVSVRGSDGHVEVWVNDKENGEVCERIVSKEPIEENVWTHLAIVCENGKLRLFMNGVLDGQQQQVLPAHLLTPREDSVLYVGKPMDNGGPRTAMLSGMEGFVAQLKHHARALSPIHVHIMCDQGPPKHVKIHDRHCFQLLVIQQTLTENKLGRLCLAKSQWLELYAKLLKFGTPRVQQAVLRLWRVLFPALRPSDIAPHVLPILLGDHDQQQEQYVDGDLADYLLAQIGVGVWTGGEEAEGEGKSHSTTDTANALEEREGEEKQAQQNSSEKVGKMNNKFKLSCDTTVGPNSNSSSYSPLLARKRKEVEVQTSMEGTSERSHHSFALSSELIMLVRLLATSNLWKSVLSERMTESMSDMSNHLFSPKHSQVPPMIPHSADMLALRSVGTLAVLGGHTESLRVGGRVAMTHADITATVVALESSSASNNISSGTPTNNSALVVMTVNGNKNDSCDGEANEEDDDESDKESLEEDLQQQSPANAKRSMRAVRMNMEELVPIPEFRSPFACLSPKKSKQPQKEPQLSKEQQLENSFFRLLEHLFVLPNVVEDMENNDASKTVLLAQCKARTLKVLHEMLQTNDCNFEQLLAKTSHEDSNIATALLALATKAIGKDRFVTLDGIEVRATVLRQRLHQLSVDRLASPYKKSEDPKKKKQDRQAQHPHQQQQQHQQQSVLMYSDDEEEEELFDEDDIEEDEEEEDEENIVTSATVAALEGDSEEQGVFMGNDEQHFHDDDEVDDEDEEDDEEDDEDDEDDEDSDLSDESDEGEMGHISVVAPNDSISMEATTSSSNTQPRRGAPAPPAYLVEELVSMGFPEEWCTIALRVQGYDLIAASTWIVDNLDMLSSTPIQDLLGATETIFNGEEHHHQAQGEDEEENNDVLLESKDGPSQFLQEKRNEDRRKIHDQKKRERKRLARAKASMRNMQEEPFNQLEEELGADVFSDNYFRTDASPSYGYGYVCGALGLYNGLHAEGTQQDSAREAFKSEIACMEFEELEKMCAEMEDELSILYSRSCLVVLLQHWRQWPLERIGFETIFQRSYEEFASFLRLVLFRGPQIMPSYDVSMLANGRQVMPVNLPGLNPVAPPTEDSCAFLMSQYPNLGDGANNILPVPPGASDGKNQNNNNSNNNKSDAHKKKNVAASSAAGSVTNLLVQAIQPALEQMIRQGVDRLFVGKMLEFVVNDLIKAGTTEEYVDKEWGIRDTFLDDQSALASSNVEYDCWLIGLLIAEGCEEVFTVDVFRKVATLLGCPNMPLKSVAMQILVSIIRYWNRNEELLEQDKIVAIQMLPYERLLALGSKRSELERRCGRVFLSKYTAMLTELLCLIKGHQQNPKTKNTHHQHHDSCKDCSICKKNVKMWFQCMTEEGVSVCVNCLDQHDGSHTLVQTMGDEAFLKSACACSGGTGEQVRCISCENDVTQYVQCSQCDEDNIILLCTDCVRRHVFDTKFCDLHNCGAHRLVKNPCCGEMLSTVSSSIMVDIPSVQGLVVTDIGKTHVVATFSLPERYIVDADEASKFRYLVELRTNQKGDLIESKETDMCKIAFDNLTPNTGYTISVYTRFGDMVYGGKPRTVKCRTLDDVPFTFDANNAGPNITILDKGFTANFSAMESWSTVLGTEGFVSGTNQWQVRVDETDSPYIFIGVASRKACLTSFLGGDQHGYGFIGDRALYHKRNRVNVYGERFGQGDVIGVCLDMDQGTLSFSRNGKDLGVAFEGLTGKLYPAFAFYNGTQKMTLIRKSMECNSIEETDEASSYTNVLDSFAVIEQFVKRKDDEKVMRAAYQVYENWINHSTIRKWTKLDREIDITKDDMKTGQKVQTMVGTGRFVGFADDRVWIDYDGIDGTWFVQDDSQVNFIKDEEQKNDERETLYHIPSKQELEHDQKTLAMSFETFVEEASSMKWSLLLDQAIVSELSAFCERRGCNPYNIAPKLFDAEVLPACRLKVRNLAARYIDDPLEAQLTMKYQSNLEEMKLVGARLAVLKVLNDHLTHVVPFMGTVMGSGVKLFSNQTISCSTSGLNQQQSVRSASFAQLAGLSSMPQKLRHIRGLLFSHVKKHYLRSILETSATEPKRSEDEYEWPENLPQIKLNRPKANFSKTLSDSESRLSYSLFGQSFNLLHFLEPKDLRISYSHPMDEGQTRSFRVLFSGEGGEDYGGLYREVFSQYASELTTTTMSPDGAAEEDQQQNANISSPTAKNGSNDQEESKLTIDTSETDNSGGHLQCVLPVLHPCPNRQHNVGGNREKFILKPGFSSNGGGSGKHLLMEYYNFAGQILGMSIRSKVNLSIPLASTVWKPLVGEPLNINDLKDIDHSTVTMIESLLQKDQDPYVLEAMCQELNWRVTLSDGTEVNLFPGGHRKKVSVEECQHYAKVLLEARLEESQNAVSAMRDGLTSIIPAPILALFTHEELEQLVCGRQDVDIGLLRSQTEYDDNLSEKDPHIQMFWNVLRQFSNAQKQRFLIFTWSRNSLPTSAEEFNQKFKIQDSVGEGVREDPDSYLPKSSTCFFALSLPRYTSEKIMKEKLLYAITHCNILDADFRVNDNDMVAWQNTFQEFNN